MNVNLVKIVFMLLFVTIIYGQENSNNKFFILDGTATSTSYDSKFYLSYFNDQNYEVIDSVMIKDSKFVIKGKISEPRPALLSTSNRFRMDGVNTVKFYLSPNLMNVKCDFNNLSQSEFKGSNAQKDFLELKKMKAQIVSKQDSLFVLRIEAQDAISNSLNLEQRKIFEKKIISIDEVFDNTIDDEIITEFEFIKKMPQSYLCIDLLLSRVNGRKANKYFTKIQDLYDSLSMNLKNSMEGILLKEKIILFSENLVGQKIKDYSVIDINEVRSKFSDLRNGKYVLLDFWASWCAPCRADTPYLKKLYNDYHDKGFEIIGLSKDQNKKLWLEAIKKDDANWKHILLQENDKAIEESFFITSIPVKILIDPTGVIIGRWRGGGQENEDGLVDKITEIFKNK